MPKGTKVDRVYQAIKHQELAAGASKQQAESKAARISQAKTGEALATGKPPKGKR